MRWLRRKPEPRRPTACTECGSTDRFILLAQEVSIDADRLDVLVEHVVVTCAKCKCAWDISRGKIVRYKGSEPAKEATGETAQNGPPSKPEEADSDLPQRFRGARR
mgnify:CR=1 FL=1